MHPWDALALKSERPLRFLCVKYAQLCVNGNSALNCGQFLLLTGVFRSFSYVLVFSLECKLL